LMCLILMHIQIQILIRYFGTGSGGLVIVFSVERTSPERSKGVCSNIQSPEVHWFSHLYFLIFSSLHT